MSSSHNRLLFAAVSVAGAWLLGACAHEPSVDVRAQLARTENSITQAEQAGAGQGALPDLQAAKDKLADAQAQLDKKSDDGNARALRLAQQAEVDAQYAAAKSQSQQQRQAAQQLQESIESLRRQAAGS